MKSRIYFVTVVFVILSIFSFIIQKIESSEHKNVNQKTYELPAPANLGIDIDDPHWNEKLIQEVKQNFAEELAPLNNVSEAREYTVRDLQKLRLLIGKEDTHFNSLLFLLSGMSFGEKRLYIVNGQPNTSHDDNRLIGFILYKKIDGNDVLETVRRGEIYWEVTEVKIKKPREK